MQSTIHEELVDYFKKLTPTDLTDTLEVITNDAVLFRLTTANATSN
ncbi:hypothetical protein [Macrococcus animalis]